MKNKYKRKKQIKNSKLRGKYAVLNPEYMDDFNIVDVIKYNNKLMYIATINSKVKIRCSLSIRGMHSKKVKIKDPFITFSKYLYDNISNKHYKFILGHELGHIELRNKNAHIVGRNLYEELMCDLYSIKYNNINLQDFYEIRDDVIRMNFYKREMKARFKILERLMKKYEDSTVYDKVLDSFISHTKIINIKKDNLKASNDRNRKDIMEMNKNREIRIPIVRRARQLRMVELLKERNKEL